MSQPTAVLATKYFFVDFIGGIVAFPIWWYTRGLAMMIKWSVESIRQRARDLNLHIWIKNIFVPMYGETDIASRIISFFLRVVMIIARTVAVGFWAIFVLVFFLAYVAALPVSIVGMLYHVTALVYAG